MNSWKARHVAGMSRRYVLGAVRARTRKGPIQRKESRERGEACAPCLAVPRAPLRTALSARPAGRRRAPPCAGPARACPSALRSQLRLALVLQLLQKRPHQRRLEPFKSGRVLAWNRRVRGHTGASGAGRSVEGHPRGDSESLIANSTSGARASQSSARSPVKARRTSAMTPFTRPREHA